jgi:hypothetical protein
MIQIATSAIISERSRVQLCVGGRSEVTVAVALKVHDGLVLAADSASTLMGIDPTGSSSNVLNVYNTANKIFNLRRGLPIGAVTWGSGAIGPASISTLAKDLRKRFAGDDPNNANWALDPDSYSVRDVADTVREFMYEEHYLREFGSNQYRPPLSFLVGGYSSGERLAEAYHVEISVGGDCPPPRLVSGPNEIQARVFWEGEKEAIHRLLAGFGTGLPGVLHQHLGVPIDQIDPAMNVIEQALETPLVQAAMPIQDVIDLAELLVDLTIGYSRFSPGAPSVGGPCEIAAITKHEHFKWIRRKHYFSVELNP